jgi:mycothiol synthase
MIGEKTFTLRSLDLDRDLEAVTRIINRCNEAEGDPSRHSPEEIRIFLSGPDYYPQTDAWVARADDGQTVAFGEFMLAREAGRVWADCAVDPDYRGRGIGRALIQAAEPRILERGTTELAPHLPIYINRAVGELDKAGSALLESEGYHYIRTFFTMLIDFDGPITPDPLPEGLELRPFDEALHTRAVYDADMEAFADHWGFVPSPYEDWAHYMLKSPLYDPTAWLIAWDGDQVAGLAINRAFGEGDPDQAYVHILAVRRPWRRRGLGAALLRQTFALYQGRGYKRVSLGVDSSSKTNAVALYERVGMRVTERRLAYRKILRGTEADIKD